MKHVEWRGSGVFYDYRNDREIEQGEVVELPENVIGSHDFVEVEEPDTTDATPTPDDDNNCSEDGCSRTVTDAEYCWQHPLEE